MPNSLYQQMQGFNTNNFMKQLNDLKAKGGDPNQIIQNMLNSGKVTQKDYNNAVLKANQIIALIQRAR